MQRRLLFADFNNHLLPGMHDGPTYLAESVSMLNRLRDEGVARIMLTPTYHPSYESIRRFRLRRNEAWRLLRTEIPRGMCILLGAQIALEPLCAELPDMPSLALPNSNYLMIELPLQEFGDWINHELHLILHKRKLIPVFAHFERYLVIYPREVSDKLMTVPGAAYQFGVRSLHFPQVITAVRKLASQGKPVLFGTGAHSDNHLFNNFSATLDSAREKIGIPLYSSALMQSFSFASFSGM